MAEIETGTRFRATACAAETDYGVVLADRVRWPPIDMLGEVFGQLTASQCQQVAAQVVAVVRGERA